MGVLDDFNDFYDPRLKHANLAAVREQVEVHQVDVRDAAAVSRAVGRGRYGAIFHLAARAGVGPSISEPHLYVDTNITGTLNLLEAARVGGVGTVCVCVQFVGVRARADRAVPRGHASLTDD